MTACRSLAGLRMPLSRLESNASSFCFSTRLSLSSSSPLHFFSSCSLNPPAGSGNQSYPGRRRFYLSSCVDGVGAVQLQTSASTVAAAPVRQNVVLEIPQDSSKDTVEQLLSESKSYHDHDVSRLMKMERKLEATQSSRCEGGTDRWFPYLDNFKADNGVCLSSAQVLEALDPYIMVSRKERFRNVVNNRSYSVCLVVEGLADFGNVSAAFRSADALGFQSVHVVSCESSKRYRDNRHVSMGAEKWLDIELWDSTKECFKVLKSRGYRIATTHVGIDTVSVYDMDWTYPTAIVVGNENKGISDEALELSDLRCNIPMNGMVDSFNVSVAAGIVMHQAICNRNSRMGCHGDLTSQESQILLAEFFLRHSKSAISIANEYSKRKLDQPISKL
ncbi:uncharacterized protein LOC113751076 [Coffea eugenioides]|uniref:uncharacterized protein LOC113751076 n=1 Tax=Coffea eugenioides TaxID=49369 RepID=UPI000F6137A3|nr:uncharacterized protein LOC113751076 [Coffea eugenioides]XP_027150738.1 uncharacterized protein LOC113751076 [Coffea eugenioides]